MARVRMADVAREAGVSVSTVSLALSGAPSRIPEATRDLVRRTAAEIGYRPNSLARGLRTRRTDTIGLVSDQIATTPFAGLMLRGAQQAAREAGRILLLVDTEGDVEAETEAIRALADHQVDAMIYASMWHREVDRPAALPPGTVFLDCAPRGGGPAVVPDETQGAGLAMAELLGAGHTRIGYVGADEVLHPEVPAAAGLRRTAYRSALESAGIAPGPALEAQGAISASGGRAAATTLLDRPEGERPTALFCFNDRMAAGAIAAARAHGLEIPADVSIVGFDDQPSLAADLDPPLTTIALPHLEMGAWAVRTAVRLLEAEETGAEEGTTLIPCALVRRGTVAAPTAR